MSDTAIKTGRLSTRTADGEHYRDLLVRQLEDGSLEYLVGATAFRSDGWAELPSSEKSRVRWDSDDR